MSKRNSHDGKVQRRQLRIRDAGRYAELDSPEPIRKFRYLYEVGDPSNQPGPYNPADVDTIVLSACSNPGCDCDDVLIGARTTDGRQLVLGSLEHVCGSCMTKRLKDEARRHGIPDCVIGSSHEDADSSPVKAWVERHHVCEKHPA